MSEIQDHSEYQLIADSECDDNDEYPSDSEMLADIAASLKGIEAWQCGEGRIRITEYVDGVRLEPAMLTREELAGRQAAREQPLYLAVFQRQGAQWLVFAPDVPEVTGIGATRDEAEQAFALALAAHLKTLRANGQPLPEPTADARFVSAAA